MREKNASFPYICNGLPCKSYCPTLKMKAVHFSEVPVTICQGTRHLHSHCREDLTCSETVNIYVSVFQDGGHKTFSTSISGLTQLLLPVGIRQANSMGSENQ
jgi:hypothetical protein